MLRILLLLFCSLLVGCLARPRIVGGTNAAEGEFPYIVSVRFFKVPNCGGSIIDEYHILTAAHCLYYFDIDLIDIQYGLVQTRMDDTNAISVESAIIHPGYIQEGNYPNDIAVLKLSSPIPFSETVAPVILPNVNGTVPEDSDAVVIGWGNNAEGQPMTDLQKVDITLFSYAYCEQSYPLDFDKQYHVCAGVPEGGKGACNGDSGGPVTVDGVQYGVVSWSYKPCTSLGHPEVCTNVANYIEWIWEQTK